MAEAMAEGYRLPRSVCPDDELADFLGPFGPVSRLSDRAEIWLPVALAEDDAAFRFAMEAL